MVFEYKYLHISFISNPLLNSVLIYKCLTTSYLLKQYKIVKHGSLTLCEHSFSPNQGYLVSKVRFKTHDT